MTTENNIEPILSDAMKNILIYVEITFKNNYRREFSDCLSVYTEIDQNNSQRNMIVFNRMNSEAEKYYLDEIKSFCMSR